MTKYQYFDEIETGHTKFLEVVLCKLERYLQNS